MKGKPKQTTNKDTIPIYGTPQPSRTESLIKNETFVSCFNKLVFK